MSHKEGGLLGNSTVKVSTIIANSPSKKFVYAVLVYYTYIRTYFSSAELELKLKMKPPSI
jgi:hypothetical protein